MALVWGPFNQGVYTILSSKYVHFPDKHTVAMIRDSLEEFLPARHVPQVRTKTLFGIAIGNKCAGGGVKSRNVSTQNRNGSKVNKDLPADQETAINKQYNEQALLDLYK